ncbi:hypothetical protein VNO80_04191 [Phaseolus coccineus]|uniref:Uncharacterized protein n=1 Tax=Phaseolus coccineus TaxID=3886 RepID=A0AAN9NY75_PHACN
MTNPSPPLFLFFSQPLPPSRYYNNTRVVNCYKCLEYEHYLSHPNRYALGHGAAAIAVNIEEDIHPGITGDTLTTKMTVHQVQRRNVAGSLEGEPRGSSLGHGYVAGL